MGAFRFKQFTIEHDRSTMKVGTDAVLLGAWVDVNNVTTILDVGTGSGVIALILAQRTVGAQIDAIEPDIASAKEAQGNFEMSPWAERLHICPIPLEDHVGGPYDLIVSNPPYFINSLLPPTAARQSARHVGTLTHEGLLTASKVLLSKSGRLALILPKAEGDRFQTLAIAAGWVCRRSLAFFSKAGRPQERWLFEFELSGATQSGEQLYLYNRDGDKSEEYNKLTSEFYL